MVQRITINVCYGGFNLSGKAIERYEEIKKITFDKEDFWARGDIPRDDPVLHQVIEELGEDANGRCADLRVIEIPDGVDWIIEEYDGMECVAEKHRTWY